MDAEVQKKVIAAREAADAIISAIEQTSSKERENFPSNDFADNYNRIRAFCEPLVEVKELLPPAVKHGMLNQATARYVEFLAYAKQIKGNLPELPMTFG
jgi:hypothetical protein